jgi:putative transposase
LIVSPRPNFSILRQCGLLDLERSSFYYTPQQAQDETDVMNAIAEIHSKWPYYGYRKVRVALRDEGFDLNHKRVHRLLKLMGFKAIYPGPKTSIPGKEEQIYPYLLKGLSIVRPNQVWAVDISYIRLPGGMVYLFALIDWYSRYIVGWKLATTMEAEHAVETFRKALCNGTPEITNMDQGSQFTGGPWLLMLKHFDVKISHTGVGRCIDNVRIERFWRSIKYEDVHLRQYANVREAREGIGLYIIHYNNVRPHQALGYAKPKDLYFEK